jgi:hypothetical protein
MSKQAGSGELVDELNYSVSARSVVDQSWLAYETRMPGRSAIRPRTSAWKDPVGYPHRTPGTEPILEIYRGKARTAALYFILNPSVCYRASPNLAQ